MKKLLLFTYLLFFVCCGLNAQVAINTTGNNPSSSAMLDVSSTNKGVLITRMTAAQRKAILSPETGLLVFDTDRQTIYFYDGQKWKPMMAATDNTAPLASVQVPEAEGFSGFGAAVDLYDNHAIVGAPEDSAGGAKGGSVYVFTKEAGSWKQTAKLSPPGITSGEHFGAAVCLFGDVLAVGAPQKTVGGQTLRGAVYVFKRVGEVWNYVTMVTASNGAANDQFGKAICQSASYIIVGAPYRNHSNKTKAGSVYVFGMQLGAWAQKIIVNATDPATDAAFGFSLDIWQSKLVVGAPEAEALTLAGPTNGGAIYVYDNTDALGFSWTFAQRLTAHAASHDNMQFGYSVAMYANTIVTGAPNYSGVPGSDINPGRGCVYRYAFQNGSWQLFNSTIDHNDLHNMGASVAFGSGGLLAGMPNSNGKAGQVMINYPSQFVYDEDPHLKLKFGGAVALHQKQYIITCTELNGFNRVFFGVLN